MTTDKPTAADMAVDLTAIGYREIHAIIRRALYAEHRLAQATDLVRRLAGISSGPHTTLLVDDIDKFLEEAK